MKKLLSIAVIMVFLCSFAAAENVFVTISDSKGNIAMAYEALEVQDCDSDGSVTIYDALFTAHEAGFEGGAEAGFAASDQGYGMSIDKLWGEANGGSYGYYLNNASAYSLTDAVTEGSHICAFIYTDLVSWSDTYSFFDFTAIETSADFELTLNAQGYDANWNPVCFPVEGAKIIINGNETDMATNAEGKVIIDINEPGQYLISARSDTMVLVPPVCIATIG